MADILITEAALYEEIQVALSGRVKSIVNTMHIAPESRPISYSVYCA